MPPPALFIGVVSHAGSRFEVSQGPAGLASQLLSTLAEHDVNVQVAVNIDDLLPSDSSLVSTKAVQQTLSAELLLDRAWAHFLRRPRGIRWWVTHAARWTRREWLRWHPPSTDTVRRLLNIELSHLDLMRKGLASGAPWVLVLEDDAFTSDIQDLSAGLISLLNSDQDKAFVNLSESFSLKELGITHLLTEVPAEIWGGSQLRSLLQAARPVTNTVCAILYSSTFLESLISALDDLPVEPVVPIDWKLNLALMDLFHEGCLPAGSCWMVEPAPIAQMSMRPTEILPS